MSINIKILGYGSANYGSIINIFNSLNQDVEITENYKDIKNCDLLVLPGVGTFPKAISFLRKKKIFEKLKKNILSGQPVIGICLGMQLLTTNSTELGFNKGLNLISGEVKKIPNIQSHIGWNDVYDINNKKYGCYYFQHSYYLKTKIKKNIEAYFNLNKSKMPAIIRKQNILGLQFHPEKSQSDGYLYLAKFLKEI